MLALAILVIAMPGSAQPRPPHPPRPPAQQAQQPAGGRPNPADAHARSLAAEVTRAGRSPSAMLKLIELWRSWDTLTPGTATRLLEGLARDTHLSPSTRAYAGMLVARSRLRDGSATAATEAFDALGYVRQWRVIGPFDNEGKAGFDREMPPEAHRNEATDLAASYQGRERPVRWRAFPDVARFGYVSFDAVFRPDENVCGFAETHVRLERAQPVTLWTGAGGAVKIWWNGALVLTDPRYRTPDPDRQVAIVSARAGWNRALVKVCVTDTTWGFFFRVGDAQGGALRVAEIDPAGGGNAVQPTGGPVAGATPRLPAAPVAPLAAFERAAAGTAPTAQALEDLARMLLWTGADDPAERRAKQLAARAADLQPTIPRLRLAASTADERAELVRFATRAAELAPTDPDVLLLRANVARQGFVPEDALAILDRVPAGTPAALDAASARAAVLRELGLTDTGRVGVEAALADIAPSPALLRARSDAADFANREDAAYDFRRRALAMRWDDLGLRRAIIADALERRDAATVIEQMDALRAIRPDDGRNLMFLAETFDALGRTDESLAAYRGALELAPEDARTLVAYGRALLRERQGDAAADLFRRALAIRPQDAETRELLEQLHPAPRPDEAYATRSEEILARRRDESGYPLTVLHDLTVNTVYDNGLGSSFRQIAVQVHDAEGARRWRTYAIQFDPDSQRVDIRLARVHRRSGRVLEALQTFEQQLGEPWYRMYYDTRALVVVFPDLEPGDAIELRYRLDDVAHRNLFSDYYGDLHYLQGTDPVKRMEYVLITPAARTFYFNSPQMTGLARTTETHEATRVDRFVARDIPAIRTEPGMPGLTEIAPYLHVSTYRTWASVGHWWWGLIRDELYADDALRRTVAGLVQGATDEREKVRRIHDWVVHNTRYVALEFGIHGYKPYRVPQIVQRGFGDCKDKASLLYTMLREAGIDARMVLVRTRRNGDIAETPASLSVFDHAIAYVPGLDLYLDGTAEHSGITELPNMDQGVDVLVVGPDGAELRRTPVLAADRNRRTRRLEVQLAADGTGVIEAQEEVVGGDAQQYRSFYQAEGTRAERFQRALAGIFPGLELQQQTFRGLDDLEAPVRFTYRMRVPRFAPRDGSEMRVPGSVMDDLTRSLAVTATREHALDLGGTSSYVEERTLRLPPGTRVTTMPQGGTAASEFGRLQLSFEASGRDVVARTQFDLTHDRVTAREYPQFRQWVEQADALLRQRIGIGTGGER